MHQTFIGVRGKGQLGESLVACGGEFALYSKCNGKLGSFKEVIDQIGFTLKNMTLAPCGKQAPEG